MHLALPNLLLVFKAIFSFEREVISSLIREICSSNEFKREDRKSIVSSIKQLISFLTVKFSVDRKTYIFI